MAVAKFDANIWGRWISPRLAGLIKPDNGMILEDGKDSTQMPVKK